MTAIGSDTESLLYLGCAVTFVIGLHLMNSPRTARRGNIISAAGMSVAVIIAVVVTTVHGFTSTAAPVVLVLSVGVGSVIGLLAGRRVAMTAMPQLVSAFNMVGGGAAALIGVDEALRSGSGTTISAGATTALAVMVGSLTVAGSFVAAGKLQGFLSGNPVRLPGHRTLELAAIGCAVLGAAWLAARIDETIPLVVVAVASLTAGVMIVLPIGGADMPVVISLLNACTGTAVAMTGLALGNPIMIIAGALVGAAGAILSVLMGKAMNRSIIAIVAGGFGRTADETRAGVATDLSVRETTADDVAIQLAYAHKVVIVPGYGLAAARAQHELADLGSMLSSRGVDVSYAIHPVAGRMPGQMNVLLAEANVPYSELRDLDESNPVFAQTDVALVVGANDVTNPAARRLGNPVSGMPILDVDKATSVIVLKRSMGHGYAGIDNELYTEPQTSMLFGDAKESLQLLLSSIKVLVA